VQECFNGNEASQWKKPKFEPSQRQIVLQQSTQTGSTTFVLMDKILCWYLWILKIHYDIAGNLSMDISKKKIKLLEEQLTFLLVSLSLDWTGCPIV